MWLIKRHCFIDKESKRTEKKTILNYSINLIIENQNIIVLANYL